MESSMHMTLRRLRTRDRIRIFLYNPENKTCCHRTAGNWLSVLSFFGISIIILFIIHVMMTYGLMQWVAFYDSPWKTKEGLLENPSPEISIVPGSGSEHTPLIWFKKTSKAGYLPPSFYQKQVDSFFKEYDEAEKNADQYSTCPDSVVAGKPCIFKKSDLGDCATFDFASTESDLCFYVKLSNVPEWTPKVATTDVEFPSHIPEDIYLKLMSGTDEEKTRIWLHCEGATSFNKDHIGTVTYFPTQGFPAHFYPFSENELYLRPIVAVKLTPLRTGMVIVIQCTIFNANINYEYPRRFLHTFGIYVED